MVTTPIAVNEELKRALAGRRASNAGSHRSSSTAAASGSCDAAALPDQAQKVFQELIRTEEKYQAGLTYLVDFYQKVFGRHCTPNETAALFPQISVIKKLHEDLLGPSNQLTRDPIEVAGAYMEWAKHGGYYAVYATGLNAAVDGQQSKLEESGELKMQVANLDPKDLEAVGLDPKDLGDGSLAALMRTPLQRLTKYPLLFKELAKALEGNAAHATFAQAQEEMQALCDACNEKMKRQEDQLKLIGLVQQEQLHTLIGDMRASGSAGGRLEHPLCIEKCKVERKSPSGPGWLQADLRKTIGGMFTKPQDAHMLLLSDRLTFASNGRHARPARNSAQLARPVLLILSASRLNRRAATRV